MSQENAWDPCVVCDAPLNTNDSANVVEIPDDGPAHRTCYHREVANGDLAPIAEAAH